MFMYFLIKRLIDILGAVIGILIFFPVMLFTGIYIYLVSPGPILALAKPRVGKDGKYFNLLKFRSIIPDLKNIKKIILKK